MKLTFLGTGGAFSRSDVNYHNNALIETDSGTKILLDCGTTALESLHELDLDPLDLDAVLITHIHADHTGGLEELGFRAMFLGQNRTIPLYTHPSLYGPEATCCLWENCLKGGMMHIQDAEGNAVEADMGSYFDVDTSTDFEIDDVLFEWVRTNHVPAKDSFGLKIVTEDWNKVWFSADSTYRGQEDDLYHWADTIFHDCMWMPRYPATVHTHLEEMLELPEPVQRRTFLMHYGGAPDQGIGHFQLAKKHETHLL